MWRKQDGSCGRKCEVIGPKNWGEVDSKNGGRWEIIIGPTNTWVGDSCEVIGPQNRWEVETSVIHPIAEDIHHDQDYANRRSMTYGAGCRPT